MVAKRGQMDGETGTEFENAVELTAVDQFGESEWRAFFAVVRHVSVKTLTEEKEAQRARSGNAYIKSSSSAGQ